MKLRIALFVHGRFHAFDLARELARLGYDIHLFTNYPRRSAGRFGLPQAKVTNLLTQGALSRLLWRAFPGGLGGRVEQATNALFARWAARQVRRGDWDVAMSFSGAAEETFRAVADRPTLRVLQRGSTHIRTQRQLLEEEERRAGCWLEKPSDWIVAREEREYALADAIHVLSRFAYDSFLAQGVPPEKLYYLPLGVSTRAFRAAPDVLEERCRRILAGEPLRVLNVGTFSYRKGALEFAELLRRLDPARFRFRFVGPVAHEARALQRSLADAAEFRGKRPQSELAREYEWGDVFLLPTIEDGFAVVLCQALAAGLPLLTTPNCAGPELVHEGETGWVVPIRAPDALAERLLWLDAHRAELADAVRRVALEYPDIDWKLTGKVAENNVLTALATRACSPSFAELAGRRPPPRAPFSSPLQGAPPPQPCTPSPPTTT